MAIQSINPATGKVTKTFEELTDAQIEQKLATAHDSFLSWRNLSIEERAVHMRSAAMVIRHNSEEYAQLLTNEMGKTITQARAEVEKCAWNFEYYADSSAEYLAPRIVETDATKSYVSFVPTGVILNIMPWNFAFWQALRMAAPILMAGNTIVLKHASNVPRSALAIQEILETAGVPAGVYQTLLIGSSKIEKIIKDDRITGVSLTGSERAGRSVGSIAGEAIKPVVLELGGSDPSIILADADIDFACSTAATSRLQNNGQSCIGSKRFIVVDEMYDTFIEKLKIIFDSYVVGDPTNDETMLGPVVSEAALNELLQQINNSVEHGATIVTGGKRIERPGYFLEPTILENVTPEVPSYHEEIFGPVASVIRVSNVDEAITVANATKFGLGASIYSQDIENAEAVAARIEAGSVFINGLVKSDPRLPFGGIKASGVGRELSEEGIKAFTNTKTTWIK